MTTFAERILPALAQEQNKAFDLERYYGCEVSRFGQGQLPDHVRVHLKDHPDIPLIRWLPDLLVVKEDFKRIGRSYMWLVDVKVGRTDTQNWIVEKKAHEAHMRQRDALGLPIVYIWPDGCSCSYVEDLIPERLTTAPQRGNGSGTPSWLFPKKYTRTLEDVFGEKVHLSRESVIEEMEIVPFF